MNTGIGLLIIGLLLLLILSELQGADWNDFQRKHLIDPPTANRLDRQGWNNWLAQRLAPETNPNQQYGTKQINTVIADYPNSILQYFQASNYRHNGAQNFYWTSQTVPTYNLKLRHDGSYEVFNCHLQYILAGIVGNEPVHLHRYYSSRPSTGNIQSGTSGCTIVQ